MTKPTQDKETLREAVCKAIVNAHGGYYPKADAAIATMFERLRTPNDEPTECPHCDGFGKCWNNADPTSGQWQPCEECNDKRGRP